MATGGSRKGLTASILASSEEIFDIYCQPCNIDNIHSEAQSFCQECQEYLCTTCITFHQKVSATRHHTLLDKSSMPKTTPTPKVKDILTEKCTTHPDKVIEYFCNVHSELCCSLCLSTTHKTCTKSYIPKICDVIAGSPEYQKLRTDLDNFVSMVTNHQKQIKIDIMHNQQFHSKALADIKEFRKEINLVLDKLEQDAVKKVSQLNDENTEKLKKTSEKCQALLMDVKQMSTSLDDKVKLGKMSQLFVGVKLNHSRMAICEGELNAIKSIKIQRYVFHQDEKLHEMTSSLSSIWSLSVRQDAADTRARYIREFNVKSADDKKDCAINGITVLTGDRIVVTDYDNKSLKLVDVKHNKVMCSASLSSEPLDITVVKEDQVAVTLGNVKTIEIYTVSDTIVSKNSVIKIDGLCAGIEYSNGRFFTVCQHPGAVKIIDISGKVLSTFSADSNGKPLFTMPRYIALSRDHDVLYVTDHEDHTVTCMTIGGKVISVYKHGKLKCPEGVAVDTGGSVYVCSRDNHTVHLLTPTGTLIQILILGQENGLATWPDTIAHGDNDDKLYISSASISPDFCNYVKVFQLE